jgi:hypothetical protein
LERDVGSEVAEIGIAGRFENDRRAFAFDDVCGGIRKGDCESV